MKRKPKSKRSPSPRGGEGRGESLLILSNSRSPQAKQLLRLAQSFAKTLKLGNAELSLSLVSDPAIRKLKREYFGIDAATDVLSFPAGDFPGPGPRPLGDIVISLDTARRAAKELGTTQERELALYLAHGLLHLLGFDHQTPKDARRMAHLEQKLLGHAGMLARSDEL